MERESFVFKKRWKEAIDALDETMQLEIYKTLAYFGLTGEIPEGVSPICRALLISFSAEIKYNDAKYEASIKNGKLGGRPRKEESEELETQENPSETQENPRKPSKTQEENLKTQENPAKPNKTQEQKVETQQNPSETLYDYEYEYNNSLLININILSERARACEERELEEYLMKYYKDYFSFWGRDNEEMFKQVIWSMIKILTSAGRIGEIVFNRKHYKFDCLVKMIGTTSLDDLRRIIFQASNNDDIRNLHMYILGALINCAEEREALWKKKKSRQR